MKRLNVEAIVLKNINYQDTSKIYTLLTKDRGKITAIARGVRKISSKRAGSLDSLSHVQVSLSEDKTGFYSVLEVKTIDSFSNLKKHLELILMGVYFAELVDVFLEKDHESRETFSLLKAGLNVLAKNPIRGELIANVFEFRFLEKLGFGLTVNRCVNCGRVYDSTWDKVSISLEKGGFLCSNCRDEGKPIFAKTALLFNQLAFAKNLSPILEFEQKYSEQLDSILKVHLKNTLTANARFSRLNSFLTQGFRK